MSYWLMKWSGLVFAVTVAWNLLTLVGPGAGWWQR